MSVKEIVDELSLPSDLASVMFKLESEGWLFDLKYWSFCGDEGMNLEYKSPRMRDFFHCEYPVSERTFRRMEGIALSNEFYQQISKDIENRVKYMTTDLFTGYLNLKPSDMTIDTIWQVSPKSTKR